MVCLLKNTHIFFQAAKLSTTLIPVAGAIVGTIFGGPVGMLVGAHGAMLLGSMVVGGAVGYGAVKHFTAVKDAAVDSVDKGQQPADQAEK